MDGKRKKLILISALACLVTASPLLYSQPGNEAYYSTEIDDAVAHAKRNPVDNRYVGARWYNRTTSRSFDLPKLLNTEMDQQMIEGAVGATAAGEQATVVQAPVRQASLGRTNKTDELDEASPDQEEESSPQKVEQSETETYIEEIKYSGKDFSGASRRIRANVSITARVRP